MEAHTAQIPDYFLASIKWIEMKCTLFSFPDTKLYNREKLVKIRSVAFTWCECKQTDKNSKNEFFSLRCLWIILGWLFYFFLFDVQTPCFYCFFITVLWIIINSNTFSASLCLCFPWTHWLYLDMLNEIVFVEVRSNATGYQETLLQTELLLLITTERKDGKTIFQQDNEIPSIQPLRSKFRNRIITRHSMPIWTRSRIYGEF